jgi:hypothetical protein
VSSLGDWAINHLPFGILIVGAVLVSWLADRTNFVATEIKTRLIRNLYGATTLREADGTYSGAKTVYDTIRAIFGARSISSFLFRSALVTLMMLTVLFLLQAYTKGNEFDKVSDPFLTSLWNRDASAWIIVIGVIVVDFLSISQTIFFLRISAYCRAVWEIIVLTAADIILSLVIFIFILPIFVTAGFLVPQKTDGTVVALLSTTEPTRQTSQNYNLLRSLLIFDPRHPSADIEDIASDIRRRQWLSYEYKVSVVRRRDADSGIEEVFHKALSAGSLSVLAHGHVDNLQALEFVADALKREPEISGVKILEKYNTFYAAMILLRYRATPAIQLSYFSRVYSSVLTQMNFLDDKIFDIIRFSSPSISQSDVIAAYSSATATSKYFRSSHRQYNWCDGEISFRDVKLPFDLDQKFDNCKGAISLESFGLGNLASFARYNLDQDLHVPISPFALSSLTATIAIYYLIFSGLALRVLRLFVGRISREGEATLERYFFVITTLALAVISLPIFFIASKLF